MSPLRRFQIFLGPSRFRAFIALLGITGLISLMLNVVADDYEVIPNIQLILVLIFVVGASYLIGSRLSVDERKRWLAIIFPSVITIAIGGILRPDILGLFIGLGIGWIVAGVFVFGGMREPSQYKQAIKHMRKQEYSQAIDVMNQLIKDEPDDIRHYRFRGELYRLWGKLPKALKDYEKMTKLAPDSAIAFTGLAEVHLQAGQYERARDAGLKAVELAPDEWVALYNLGMIEDRLKDSSNVVQYIQQAFELGIPDSRHRILANLYLARAYARQGQIESAEEAVTALQDDKNGVEEWQIIMGAKEAETLRAVLEDDIRLVEQLLSGQQTVQSLAT